MSAYELPEISADSWQAAACAHCPHPLGHHDPFGHCLGVVERETFSVNCKCVGYHPTGEICRWCDDIPLPLNARKLASDP